MKVGLVTTYFHPVIGGVEDLNFSIAKELVKRGHEVHVFTSDRKDDDVFKSEETIEGINIHRSPTWFSYKYYIHVNPGLILNVLKYDFDILHVQSIGFLMSDISVVLKKLFSKTILINTPQGPFMALDKYKPHLEILKTLYRMFEYPINKLYHGAIQSNPEQYPWMVKAGFSKRKIKFIPNSVPNEIFRKVDSSKLVKKHKLEDRFVVTYIGRIQKYKGLDQIIRALPKVKKVQSNILFVAMGKDVGDKQRLQSLAKQLGVQDNVKFLGLVSEDDKLAALDISEIFILPSEWEAFGLVLVEAMARKNALISSRTEGGRFIIEEGINGFTYDYKDVEMLKEKFLELVKDSGLREKIKLINLKDAKKYTVAKMAKRLEDYYQALLEKK